MSDNKIELQYKKQLTICRASRVNEKIFINGFLIAYGAVPGRPVLVLAVPGSPVLVHRQEDGGVEALQMCAGRGPAGVAHSNLPEGTQEGATQWCGWYNLKVSILFQFFFDCKENATII